MSPAVWRLIEEETPSAGGWNMALDRAIQLQRAEGHSPATLRLYRWERPTVSLGRFQSVDSIDLDACQTRGIDVVRRFTGGRGVLHDDELTYSVVADVSDGVPRGTNASYRHLCEALVEAYRRLGVDADLTPRPRGPSSSGACYLHATHADVSAGALKLSGSAQVWHRDVVLQHGSVALSRDVGGEGALFGLSSDLRRELAATTATLGDLVVPLPTLDVIVRAVRDSFEQVLGVELSRGTPTLEEETLALSLVPETTVEVGDP